ncbi:MAG: dipeptidase [Thermoanaerobaculia bacterium]
MNRTSISKSTASVALALVVGFVGCRGSEEPPVVENREARSEQLAQEFVIVDTHVDVPYRLMEEMEDISVRTKGGDFDYPRAVAGGLNAPFMSIFVPASYQETGGAREYAEQLIDLVEGFSRDWPDKFAPARSPAEVRENTENGRISLPMGMENGAAIEDELENLRHFHERGIRYITLTHGENNQICDSSYADEQEWGGLSPFGREVVAEMNRLGIMIDISHVTDETFYQVLELSQAPVIASHSSCRRYTPGWERNMDDEMIRRLGEQGGVIHINFGSAFLTQESYLHSEEMWEAVDEYLEANGLEQESKEAKEFVKEYRKENPPILADVADVAHHIDHVVELAGIDHVGLGSDFDGVGGTTPTGLRDVSFYPSLIRELLDSGYSEEEIRKICGENTLRVWAEVEQIAAELRGD